MAHVGGPSLGEKRGNEPEELFPIMQCFFFFPEIKLGVFEWIQIGFQGTLVNGWLKKIQWRSRGKYQGDYLSGESQRDLFSAN